MHLHHPMFRLLASRRPGLFLQTSRQESTTWRKLDQETRPCCPYRICNMIDALELFRHLEWRSRMNKLFAAVALATVIVSPAFAQSYSGSAGSGNLNSMPYASNQHNPIHSTNPMYRGTGRRATPHDAYARTPYDAYAPTRGVRNGHRSPHAQ